MIDNLHINVTNAINNESYEYFTCVKEVESDKDRYIYNTALRLINIWRVYRKDSKFQVDFECSLRNYLILMKKDIYIKGYSPSEVFSSLSLQINDDDIIWVRVEFPNYVNSELVKKIIPDNIENNITSKENEAFIINPYIKKLTGFKRFRSNEQKMAVMGALKTPPGYTTLVSLSTGGGKSLVTQTVAYQQEGLTIVIVPTISLMIDQVKNAKKIIKSDVDNEVFYYYSGRNINPFLEALKQKTARLLFISPESIIKNNRINEALREANDQKYLKNIIIDEAHIITEWGSQFRLDFQCFDSIRNSLLTENKELRTFLLSATYSDDTVSQLKLFYGKDNKWIEIRCDKLRHELRYDIIKAKSRSDKNKKLIELIKLLPHPMIVYVKSPSDAENLKVTLNELGFNNVNTFTGNTPTKQRERIIGDWKNNVFDLMIATCAFGIGVDKKDIRTVLHAYIPENPNKYYQEAGRGGRDGLPSLSTMLYIDDDIDDAFNFVNKVISTEKLVGRWISMVESNEMVLLENNRYIIDTNIKPQYNVSDTYADYVNDQDIAWNVYVILFLRRYGLLTIDNVYYNSKYTFEITLRDRSILYDNDKTRKLFDEIRNKEWIKNKSEFFKMKRNITQVGNVCWSSMFNDIYTLTDEYCAGCNNHKDVMNYESKKIIKKEINYPLSIVADKVNDYCYGASYLLVLDEDYKKTKLIDIVNNGIDVLIGDNNFIESFNNDLNHTFVKGSLTYFNYNDFISMNSSYKYYISGAIVILFPKDTHIQNKILNIIDNNTNKDITYILLSEEDYFLGFRNKYLSEVINGPCK